VPLKSRRLSVLAAAACVSLALPAVGAAASLRDQRSVFGVRATLEAYFAASIAGNGRSACALMTPAAQVYLARSDHAASCQKATEVVGALLRWDPLEAAQLRSYAATVRITLNGDTATVPKLNQPGRGTLIYTRGRWYLAS
jgi:hypothetical protein